MYIQYKFWFITGGDKPAKKDVNNSDPKPDSSFYDKLPFHGLKTPPKKVRTKGSRFFAVILS